MNNSIYKLINFCYFLSINAIKPNFCVNCKHFRYDFFSGKQFGKCALFPIIQEKDRYYLVIGQKKNTDDYHYCSVARGDYKDMCGPEGKCFEQKNEYFYIDDIL
jgi:hypothetical protein